MKDRILTYLALALSVASLCYAAWVHQNSEELAMRAWHKRETELVRHWTPKFKELFEGVGPNAATWLKPPMTLEELFDPLIKIMNAVGTPPDSVTNAPPDKKQ